jgi:DNA-binding transcriptional MerR regulator
MQIGTLSTLTGLSRDSLRFYEKRGLLQARRSANGYRDYPEEAVQWLGYVRTAQQLGFTLAEIAADLPLLAQGDAAGPRYGPRWRASWRTSMSASWHCKGCAPSWQAGWRRHPTRARAVRCGSRCDQANTARAAALARLDRAGTGSVAGQRARQHRHRASGESSAARGLVRQVGGKQHR